MIAAARKAREGLSVGRPAVSFIVWSRNPGRARELATSLGGEHFASFPTDWLSRRGVPFRYLVSLGQTAAYLARRRPRSLVVQNPPIVPGLLGLVYARMTGARIVLDSHPSSFGVKGDELSRRLLPIHRWLARRVGGVLVTSTDWVDKVESWGARGLILHEAPPLWSVPPAGPIGDPPRVLFVGVFAPDEPVAEVIEAARASPAAEWRITGDPTRARPGLLRDVPWNVKLLGWLDAEAYAAEMAAADVVLVLTTEPTSVMRAAYEAVYWRRPLVVTDWPILRELFPHAVFVRNEPDALAAAVTGALERHDGLLDGVEEALAEQVDRWAQQESTLRELLGLHEGAAGNRGTYSDRPPTTLTSGHTEVANAQL